MPYLDGSNFERNPIAAAARIGMQLPAAANALAFMHWIGDEDRGLSDVMYSDNTFFLIDNGLCGPGTSTPLRGYHPTPEVYTTDRIILKCYGGGKPSFVEFLLGALQFDAKVFAAPGALQAIEDLSDETIREVVSLVHVDKDVATTLILRRATIRNDYSLWLAQADNSASQSRRPEIDPNCSRVTNQRQAGFQTPSARTSCELPNPRAFAHQSRGEP